jgi:hypothetical protein
MLLHGQYLWNHFLRPHYSWLTGIMCYRHHGFATANSKSLHGGVLNGSWRHQQLPELKRPRPTWDTPGRDMDMPWGNKNGVSRSITPNSNGGKDDKTQDFGVPCFQTNAHDAGTCATHNLHCQVSTVGFNEGIRKVLGGPHATQTPWFLF